MGSRPRRRKQRNSGRRLAGRQREAGSVSSTTVDEDRSLHYIANIPLDEIIVEGRRRSPDPEHIAALAESISSQGLLCPILVREADETPGLFVLIAGWHRMQAVESLGHRCIACHVIGADDIEAELAEIDENLIRSELTELERAECLARRKQLYEELHPEAAQFSPEKQAARRSSEPRDKLSPGFAQDTAAKTGVSDRTVQRATKIGTDITAEVRDIIRETPVADNQQELLRLARMEPEKQAPVAQKIADGEARSVGEAEKLLKREAAAEIAATATLPELVTLHQGDFNEVLAELHDDSVDLIFTDPPYNDEIAPLYEQLAAHASRILKPGGSLITYVGQNILREAMNHMDGYLRYWWILCAHHQGGAARLAGKYVIVEWKPLLWYVRDRRRTDAEYLVDFVEFGREPGGLQTLHDWQQQEAPARFAIEKLTQPGDVVLDPFLGSGTTLAAAVKLGRRGIGVELDPQTLAVATARLAECRSLEETA